MNQWGRDQYQNMITMGYPSMPPPLPGQNQAHPLMQPQLMLPEMAMPINPAPPVNPPLPDKHAPPLIGPVLPDNLNSVDMTMSDDENDADTPIKNSDARGGDKKDGRDQQKNRESKRDRDKRDGRDHDDRGRHNDRNERNNERGGRDRSDRNRDRDRRRGSKWESTTNANMQGGMNRAPLLPDPVVGDQGMGQGMIPGMGSGGPGMGYSGPGMGYSGPGLGTGMGPGGPGMGQGMGPGRPGMGQGMGPGGPGMGQGMGTSGPSMAQGMGHGGSGMGQGMGPAGPDMGQGMGHGGQGMGMGSDGSMGPGSQGLGPGGMTMSGMMQQYGMQNMPSNNMGNMMPGMNNMNMPNMMNNNMMDPNMMMMNPNMMMPNQPLYVTDAMLLPPIPGAQMPNRREKPTGCRTIFVGGLPKGVTEQTIAEIFQNFGEISDIKLHRQGVCHVRFENHASVEASFFISGYRFKMPDQTENEATTLFVDYALNRDDQNEYERNKKQRAKTPPRIEQFSPNALTAITEKIKSDEKFPEAAPTLLYWLERGECNKRNANVFYSLIQATNNQVRRLFNDKMTLDEEYHNMKAILREKFATVVEQFEQVAKILTVAKHQRVSDHFTKQQRRNIEMWLKMTEEVENIKDEFNTMFDEEEIEKAGREVVSLEKYEKLRLEHENLVYELEGYKNEAFLAKDEAERKFEKFKAHYIAQQALQNNKQGGQVFPPLPQPPLPNMMVVPPLQGGSKPQPPPPTPDDNKVLISGPAVPPTEARLISILTAFLMVHPLGASLDYLVSYVRSMVPQTTQGTVEAVLKKYTDVFVRKTSGIGANIESRWGFMSFESIKSEQKG